MIKANDACAIADSSAVKARDNKIFKHAIEKLESDIKKAAARGDHEISYNICYFDIRPCSSLQKDEYATQADRNAIKTFMEDNGYTFYYHNVMSLAGSFNSCFTCRW